MKSLKRRLSLLRRRAFDLAELLERLISSAEEERDSLDLDQHERDVREISFELLVAISQFDECRAVHQAYWPLDEQPYRDLLAELLFSDKASMLPRMYKYGREEIVQRVVKWRMGVDDDTEIFSKMLQWRELNAAICALDDTEESKRLTEAPGDLFANTSARLKALTFEEQTEFSNAIGDYLANQWLYPRVEDHAGVSIGDRYWKLFEVANIRRDWVMFNSDALKSAMGAAELDSELRESLSGFFDRLNSAIADFGLDALGDILEDGGSPFGDLPEDWSIIPGNKRGLCPRVVIAIATSKSPTSKLGSIQVMRKLREVLIGCCDSGCKGPKTEVAIFVGPLKSMTTVIEESSGDLEKHLSKVPQIFKAFIPVGVLQKNLNVIAWR